MSRAIERLGGEGGPRVGRPRSAEAHAAIVSATLDLLADRGLAATTIEAVAARAGVGKTTIYRRWPSKVELVKEAVRSFAPVLKAPDTGSVRGDLEALASAAIATVEATRGFRAIPRLLGEALDDQELHAALLETLVEPRRAGVKEILARGVERGEIDPRLDLDLATHVIIGPLVVAILWERDVRKVRDLPGRLVDTMLRGMERR